MHASWMIGFIRGATSSGATSMSFVERHFAGQWEHHTEEDLINMAVLEALARGYVGLANRLHSLHHIGIDARNDEGIVLM